MNNISRFNGKICLTVYTDFPRYEIRRTQISWILGFSILPVFPATNGSWPNIFYVRIYIYIHTTSGIQNLRASNGRLYAYQINLPHFRDFP